MEEQDDCVAKRGDIRMGTVIEVSKDGALIDIGLKREGFASTEDLQRLERAQMGEITAGEDVPVMILSFEGSEGYIAVSVHRARLEEDWLKAEKMLDSGEVYEAEIVGHNRGGLTVQFGRIRGFIPLSHIVGLPRGMRDPERRDKLASMVGEQAGLRVIEVNRHRQRLIFSQRLAHRTYQRMRKRRLLDELEEGQRRRGVVSSITNFGAFVDLGGVDGLVHVSELSWQHVDSPRDVVDIGDEVDVIVLEVDRSRERIGLSIKQTQEDPWENVDERYSVNQLVEGVVTRVVEIGAFVELEPGIEGLLHVSELVGAPNVTPQELLESGQQELVKILRIEKNRRRIGLSARRVRREEWEEWAAEKAAQEAAEAEAAAVEEPAAEEAAQFSAEPAVEQEPADEVASKEPSPPPVEEEEELAAEPAVEQEPADETASEEPSPPPVEEEEELAAEPAVAENLISDTSDTADSQSAGESVLTEELVSGE
ncbi:MAG: 30S ribosomal protein S1 [Anaerolineae bacterium]|nr:30S ribosomal protein S1 [Anaerolineae bacterium]